MIRGLRNKRNCNLLKFRIIILLSSSSKNKSSSWGRRKLCSARKRKKGRRNLLWSRSKNGNKFSLKFRKKRKLRKLSKPKNKFNRRNSERRKRKKRKGSGEIKGRRKRKRSWKKLKRIESKESKFWSFQKLNLASCTPNIWKLKRSINKLKTNKSLKRIYSRKTTNYQRKWIMMQSKNMKKSTWTKLKKGIKNSEKPWRLPPLVLDKLIFLPSFIGMKTKLLKKGKNSKEDWTLRKRSNPYLFTSILKIKSKWILKEIKGKILWSITFWVKRLFQKSRYTNNSMILKLMLMAGS